MSVRAGTLALIEDAHRFGAFYRGEFANHLPMALVALDAMGADESELRRFASRHQAILEPMYATNTRIEGDVSQFLGRREAFAAWVEYFSRHIDDRGEAEVVGEWCERLLPGLASGAFHGLIRLAYAMEAASPRETAHALAYWAAAFAPLSNSSPRLNGDDAPAGLLAALSVDGAYAGRRRPGANIVSRTLAAALEPGFETVVARVDARLLTIDSLAQAMIRAYCASRDFTILHGVTGCHAFRSLMPFLGEREAALGHFWRALAAAYIGAGSPPLASEARVPHATTDWSVIRRVACSRDDEHDVKFAYTCWREWQCYADDRYRHAAASRVECAPGQAELA